MSLPQRFDQPVRGMLEPVVFLIKTIFFQLHLTNWNQLLLAYENRLCISLTNSELNDVTLVVWNRRHVGNIYLRP